MTGGFCPSCVDLETSRLCVQEKHARALRMERKKNWEFSTFKLRIDELEHQCNSREVQFHTKYHFIIYGRYFAT